MTAPGGGFFARFLAPESGTVPSSLVPPDVLRRLSRRGLIDTGLGILAASEQSGAGVGDSLVKGLQFGREGFSQGLKDASQQSLLGRGVGEQDRLTTLRQTVMARHPEQPDETMDQKIQRLTSAATDLVSGGDISTAQGIAQVVNALRSSQRGGDSPFTYLQKNGKIFKIDKQSGEIETIEDDGSLEAKQELAEANRQLRERRINISEENLALSGQRLNLAKEANERPGEGERKTALLLTIAQNATPTLDAAPAPTRQAWLAALGRVSEGLQPDEQKFFVAANSFMDAYVRETSGAATNPSELTRAWKTFIPEPGDVPGTLAFKKQLRDGFLAALRTKGQRATANAPLPAPAPVQEPGAPRSILDEE